MRLVTVVALGLMLAGCKKTARDGRAATRPADAGVASAPPIDAGLVAIRDAALAVTIDAGPGTVTFHGQPGWFVLGARTTTFQAADRRARKLEEKGIEAMPLQTDLFQALEPGGFVVLHGAFATRAEAESRASQISATVKKAQVVESGPPRTPGRLVLLEGRFGGQSPYFLEVTWDGGSFREAFEHSSHYRIWVGGPTAHLGLTGDAYECIGNDSGVVQFCSDMQGTGRNLDLPPEPGAVVEVDPMKAGTDYIGD